MERLSLANRVPAGRPGGVGIPPLPPGNPGLAGTVGPHHVDRLPAVTGGAEDDEAAIGRPAGVLVAPRGGELSVAAAVDVDDVDLEAVAVLTAVGDPVTLGGPAGADVVGT